MVCTIVLIWTLRCVAGFLIGLFGCHRGYGAEIFERYGEGKSSACWNGLVGVFLVCMGNLGSVLSQCCIYGKD